MLIVKRILIISIVINKIIIIIIIIYFLLFLFMKEMKRNLFMKVISDCHISKRLHLRCLEILQLQFWGPEE